MTKRENLLGRGIFEIFPDNPDDPGTGGVSKWRASLDRVRQTLASDTMAIQKYDIRGPDGVFEERFWSPMNSPVLGADGPDLDGPHPREQIVFADVGPANVAPGQPELIDRVNVTHDLGREPEPER